MKLNPHIVFFLFVAIFCSNSFGQYPRFFQYEDENGLPSNEVYSISKDREGFIWLGCDAGLFKFNGIRYIPFKCKAQKSKSIAGLTVSKNGRLYCTNFQSQLFYIENNTLKELRFPYKVILHLSCDRSGNLLVNHKDGFAIYNEKKKTWKNHTYFGVGNTATHTTRSVKVNSKNKGCFLTPSGISFYNSGSLQHVLLSQAERSKVAFASDFTLEWYDNEQWIFPFSSTHKVYRCRNGVIQQVHNPKLLKAIQGKTITNVKRLKDGNLWICTYNGIIQYDPKQDNATIYYPNFAFSDCLTDNEDNYWFSTLQSGILRVPNLNYKVWNNFPNHKLIKLASSGKQLQFATVNGDLGSFQSLTDTLQFLQTGNNTSIQSLVYSAQENCFYFYTNKNLYSIKNKKINLLLSDAPPIKYLEKVEKEHIVCSSFGAFCYDFKTRKPLYRLTEFWSREVKYDKPNSILWLAANNGLLKFKLQNGKWVLVKTLFRDKQVLSIDLDRQTGKLFLITFDGELYSLDETDVKSHLATFPASSQAYHIHYKHNNVYVATNQGLFIYNLKQKSTQLLNTFSGLASNNVQDVIVAKNTIWLATGKGLQKIPLNGFDNPAKALVYLRNNPKNVQIGYREGLVLFPETRTYSSEGNFQYAYRMNGSAVWTLVPGSINKIQLQNIPSGNFEIELKAIDYLNRDSENRILIKGYSLPPFWFTWWFILIEIALFVSVVILIFKRQLSKRQKALNYQNEMNALKLTAIKAQMNPHFIFNVLSSIKGYIYENDRQKATSYLDDFSDLMRTVLEMSEVHFISLAEELKLLKLYVELEAMMLEDFEFTMHISENLVPETLRIPSLVLQPYIENAFKHGLRHKKGRKSLEIRVAEPKQGQIVIELIDNGIGRLAAAELNSNNPVKPQSFATQALEKRISLINDQHPQSIHLEIVDLYDENKHAAGTKIQLTLTRK